MQSSLIDQREDALASRDLSKRAEMLGRVTDLFMLGSGKFTSAQIDLFDEVMGKLVEQIEMTARAAFGSRLATVFRCARNGDPLAGVRRCNRSCRAGPDAFGFG